MIGLSSLIVARIQVDGVYLQAFAAKMCVDKWADGTAMYYWLTDHHFGLPPWIREIFLPVLAQPLFVTIVTWCVILIEILLFLGITASRRVRYALFILGCMFHALIAIAIGLWSFCVAMIAALTIYLAQECRK